jgi:glycosidase
MNIQFEADRAMLPSHSAQGVRFLFDGAPDVRSVALAGTFNSWVGDACLLERVTPTRWQCTLALAPGRHLYKFVVDGAQWIADPANPWLSEDGQNNSCVTIDETGAVLMRERALGPHAPGPLHARHAALATPAWLRDGVLYQLSVRAFGADFDGVRARLAHLAQLGVDVIWMMPIHPIGVEGRLGRLGDPYAVRDFEAIDPALGDAASLRALVDAIHAHGMRIVFDWTLNRSSVDNVLTATHPDWYTHDANGQICYTVPNRAYFGGFDFGQPALRTYLIGAMRSWVERFDLDGFRFDDSDITPLDFLVDIRTALAAARPDIGIISQAYDEFHHIASCDLTYEGGTREMLRRLACGQADAAAFAQYWAESTYSFPRGALRMRWLEEKEQPRARKFFGDGAHLAAAAVLLTMDGVPHILMGQEFDEPNWRDWSVLFDDVRLDWDCFDARVFSHFQSLIGLRRRHRALRDGSTEFLPGLPAGVLGYVRAFAGESIVVLANLSGARASLPACALAPLYAQGWDAEQRILAGHGCLVGMPLAA